MKHLTLMILSIALSACELLNFKEAETTPGFSGLQIRPRTQTPSKWDTADFPLPISVSKSFSGDELTLIQNAGDEWEYASGDRLDFFDIDSVKVNEKNYANLSDYYDDEMGIYKSTSWYPGLSLSALAITQFFGFRRNAGTTAEYIQMSHADILVNYSSPAFFQFSIDGNGGSYDLPSVILHELGHFIGLYHYTDYAYDSVMAPSIGRGDVFRTPFPIDEESIDKKYFGSTSAVESEENGGITTGSISTPGDNGREGEPVSGIMELNANGECLHYINGRQVFSHKARKF